MEKNPNTIGNRTRDLPVCSAPQLTNIFPAFYGGGGNNNNNNNTYLYDVSYIIDLLICCVNK